MRVNARNFQTYAARLSASVPHPFGAETVTVHARVYGEVRTELAAVFFADSGNQVQHRKRRDAGGKRIARRAQHLLFAKRRGKR